MTKRETATVLAALRLMQERLGPPFLCGDHDDQSRANYIKSMFPDHFDDFEPMLAGEIDALCERLNLAGEPSPIEQAAVNQLERMLDHAANDSIDFAHKVEIVQLFDALVADGVELKVDTNLVAELRDDVEAAIELKF